MSTRLAINSGYTPLMFTHNLLRLYCIGCYKWLKTKSSQAYHCSKYRGPSRWKFGSMYNVHTVASYLRDNGMSSYLTSQSTLATRTRQVNAPGKLSEELLHRTLSPMAMGEEVFWRGPQICSDSLICHIATVIVILIE